MNLNLLNIFNKTQLKADLPNIRPGDTVKVHQKIKEKGKERIQIFEGLVIARKHGKGINSTITVRKISNGIGIERIFPVHAPSIAKIELVRRGKTRRAKLYYIREAKGRKARLKQIAIKESDLAPAPKAEVVEEKTEEAPVETPVETEVKSDVVEEAVIEEKPEEKIPTEQPAEEAKEETEQKVEPAVAEDSGEAKDKKE